MLLKPIKFGLLLVVIYFGARAMATPTNVADLPQACYASHKYPCALRFVKHDTLRIQGVQMTADAGASIVIFSAEEKAINLQILEGHFVLSSEVPVVVHHGGTQFSSTGEVWIEKTGVDSILVRNLNATMTANSSFFVAGLSADQLLPVGFENWYKGIGSDGRVQQGVLRPIAPGQFLPDWNRVAHLPAAQSKEKIQLYHELWQTSVQQASKLYQEVADRRIASLEAGEQAKLQRQQSVVHEREKLRQMFRERYEGLK